LEDCFACIVRLQHPLIASKVCIDDFLDSYHYLPLAEVTVLRFLVPILTALACSVVLGTSFTRKEILAGLIALVGVIFIAHPSTIFGSADDIIDTNKAGEIDDVTPTQRLVAIGVSFLGIFGAVGAYTTIRIIGSRAHALISVNYFALLGIIGSAAALLVIPGIGFSMPHGPRGWTLLSLLGILGFVLQFLLTAGLQLDKSSKATSMLYVQIVYALLFDWGIWGVLPSGWSLFGGAIVIASTLWSALQKTEGTDKIVTKDVAVDEESALMGNPTEGGAGGFERRASISA
jgi:drug/metabolite transporter (DMT)-like permease